MKKKLIEVSEAKLRLALKSMYENTKSETLIQNKLPEINTEEGQALLAQLDKNTINLLNTKSSESPLL